MIKLSAFSDEAGDSLKSQLDALKRNNIPYMELRAIDSKNVAKFTNEEALKYYEEIRSAGIEVWSIGSPLGKVDISINFNEYEKEIRHVCEIANIMHCDKIRMFSFFKAYDKKELVFDYLRKMVEIAKEYNVYLYHENEKEIYGDTKERVLEIMENVKGLKFVYDPANYLQVGEIAMETLNLFHSKTDYFHIKDVIQSSETLVPAGDGDGMIEELVSRIKDDKVLTLEPHLKDFGSFKSIDNTELKNKYVFNTNDESFDYAANALKKIIIKCGYKEEGNCFIKSI